MSAFRLFAPCLLLFAEIAGGIQSSAQSIKTDHAKFAVASIKPATGCHEDTGRGGGGVARSTLGRFYRSCVTLLDLVRTAWNLDWAGARRGEWPVEIIGGPAWVRSEMFIIEATADDTPGTGMMNGPLMQSFLEDRFSLKVRRETRDTPAYTLTAAKGGPKLQRFKEGSCTPFDFLHYGPVPDASLNPCMPLRTFQGPNEVFNLRGTTIADFCKLPPLSRLDRRVIDKTKLTGMFDFNLEIGPDDHVTETPRGDRSRDEPANDPAGPSIFTAVEQQLGLKLTAAKAPGEFIVIVSVAKPSEN